MQVCTRERIRPKGNNNKRKSVNIKLNTKIMANSKFAKVSDQYLQKLLDTKDSVKTLRVVKRSVIVIQGVFEPSAQNVSQIGRKRQSKKVVCIH